MNKQDHVWPKIKKHINKLFLVTRGPVLYLSVYMLQINTRT